jgi:hypothetical protein
MKSYTKDQNGFGALEAVLVLVIVAIVAFVGWFVYNQNQKASNTINTANQSNSSANAVNLTSTKTASAAGTRAREVATYLLTYGKTNSTSPLKNYVDKHVNDGQFTANFKAMVDSGSVLAASSSLNPVSCSATAVTGFKVGSSTLSGDSATVTLSQVSSGNTAQSQVPQLTLQYAKSLWSVDQYNCVANPSS